METSEATNENAEEPAHAESSRMNIDPTPDADPDPTEELRRVLPRALATMLVLEARLRTAGLHPQADAASALSHQLVQLAVELGECSVVALPMR